jgi:hypothetical protein
MEHLHGSAEANHEQAGDSANSKKTYKRKLTERRRLQNRAAQKAYRKLGFVVVVVIGPCFCAGLGPSRFLTLHLGFIREPCAFLITFHELILL